MHPAGSEDDFYFEIGANGFKQVNGLLGSHRLEISRVIQEAGGKLTAAGIIGSSEKLRRRFTAKQIYGLIHKMQLNDIAGNLEPQFVMQVEETDPTIYYVDRGMAEVVE